MLLVGSRGLLIREGERWRCPRETYCTGQRRQSKSGFGVNAALVDEVKLNRKKRRQEISKEQIRVVALDD
jgi:hypothetical protein